MFSLVILLLSQAFCEDQCTYKSNLISIDTDVSIDEIKDPYRPSFIRLTSPGCPHSPASQAQWEKAASLYPQVNFITIDSWKNTKITTLFGNSIMTPLHGLFLADSSTLIADSVIGNTVEIQSSPQRFLDMIYQKTQLYQIAPPLVSLSPMITDSFYTAVDDPIILLHDSRCSSQIPFLNAWAKVANEVIFSNGENPRIGMLDCSIYPEECQRWSHPYAYTTPRALIYSSKTGNYEVIDTYDNINSDKIDGLYANALSRPSRPTPSPVPILDPDFTIPSTDGYTVIENTELRNDQRTIEKVRENYISSYVFPGSACATPSECDAQTLDSPSECLTIKPSTDDHQNALKMINFFRSLAGLSGDVTEDATWNEQCYKTALNMHKIGKVPSDHIIKNEHAVADYCGEEGNIQVSKDSLLSENSKSAFMSSYKFILDEGAHNNLVVGHRRYLLHPNLKKIGIGFYPYKEEQFVGFRMMRPAVTVFKIKENESPGYMEEPVPSSLKFISWPPEGPFPLEHLPSNWHISHKDFRNANLEDIKVYVQRDDGAKLEVKSINIPKNSVNSDSLVIQMTEEALKRCLLLRTITVTVFNENLKKVYRFSFDLFDSNGVTEVCLYSSDKTKCPSTVTQENSFGPGNYQAPIFTSSTNPVIVHVVEPISLGEQKISLTASTKFFLKGETIDGKIEIGRATTVDVQKPSKTSYDINWNVKERKIGKLETVFAAKSIKVNIQDDDEQTTVHDLTFYTGRQTSLGLSKVIFAGNNYDLYYTIGGVNNNFFVMVSPSAAFAEFECTDDNDLNHNSNIVHLNSIFDMIHQKTNKRVVKIYISNIESTKPIDLSVFIPGRKRDYQFYAVGSKVYFECDMNISNVANSITFNKFENNYGGYTFEVYQATFNRDDARNVCPMDFVTINGANFDGSLITIMPYVLGDQVAKNKYVFSEYFDLFPLKDAEDNGVIAAYLPGVGKKPKCIITTSGTHSSYRINYNSDKKYDPFVFRSAPGTENKPVTISFYEVDSPDNKLPDSDTAFHFYFENYNDLTLDMPSVKFYRNLLRSYLKTYNFDNCGKVTFIGNDESLPESFEIDYPLVLGNFNYGCIIISPTVLVTGSSSYDGTWVQAKDLSVAAKMTPTIRKLTVKNNIFIDSSTVYFDGCTFDPEFVLNIKKTESWWPSISLLGTPLNPKQVLIDLGIKTSSSHLLDASEEYESHTLITGISPNAEVGCEAIRSRSTITNNGKFSLECSSDKTELVAIKGKENAPILSPEGKPPIEGETSPSADDGDKNPSQPDDGDKNPSKPDDGDKDPSKPDDGDKNPSQPDDGDKSPSTGEGGTTTTSTSTGGGNTKPVVTPAPYQTPVPEKVETLDFSDKGKDETSISESLKQKLDDMKNDQNSDSSNKVVVFQNIDKVEFNYGLGEKEFIKPPRGSTVEYNGGNLHLVIPEKVTVKLSKDQGSNLLIKGQGEVKMEFKEDAKTDKINLKPKSQINGSVTIVVPQDVKSFSMDSLELNYGNEITLSVVKENEESVDLSVNELTATAATNAVLKSLKIEKSLNVAQTAVLKVENVNIETASINFDIYDFNQFGEPFFQGKFNSLPSSLTLTTKSDQTSPKENEEYPIVSGTFDGVECASWYPKIDLGGTGFNTKECVNIPALKTLASEDKRIVLKYVKDEGKGGNKLSAGAIAGIVIGCVAGVAIIVAVVVIVVLKRKKNHENSSDIEDEANEGANENV